MTVTLRKPTSPDYKDFSREVKRRAKEKYKNFTYGEEEVIYTYGLNMEYYSSPFFTAIDLKKRYVIGLLIHVCGGLYVLQFWVIK